jgi:hypothetical protein
MKTLILKTVFFVSIITLTSCVAEKTIVLANGEHVSKRELRKICKKAYKETMKQMSEEEIELIEGSNFSVETSEQ